MLSLVWMAWAATALAADCPSPVSEAELSTTLDRAEAAFADLDPAAFGAAMDDTSFQLPCIRQPATPGQAARLHRLTGLRWFIVGKEGEAFAAFRSAATLQPEYRFPETLVPPGHAAREVFERAWGNPGEVGYLPEPLEGSVLLDGTTASERPLERPVWFQLVRDDAVIDSSYVLPSDAWPSYPAKKPPPSVSGKRNPVGFAIAATGALVASGVMYGAALGSKSSFDDDHPDYTIDDLRAHRARTNGLAAGSAATAGAGIVLGVTWVALK